MVEVPLDPDIENSRLKLGYSALFQERWPVNEELGNCSSPESAYFLSLEKEYLDIPDELVFENIKDDIPEKHHVRLGNIWRQVEQHRERLKKNAKALKKHWKKAPRIRDKRIKEMIRDTSLKIRDCYQKATKATITSLSVVSGRALVKLDDWQWTDRGLRGKFYVEHKNYIVALRLYYEMLLESSKDKEEYVLPKDHPRRIDIVIRNRYLRLIDATHQAISAAKAAHYQQKKRRLRKTENIPFVIHAFDVTLTAILDSVPFTIENQPLKHNPVILGAVGPIHDIIEDTQLNIAGLLDEFLKRLTDKYDSSLDPVIKGAFEGDSKKIKNQALDLMGRGVTHTAKQIMRILSNNTELTDKEKKAAIEQNIAGFDQTLQALGLQSKQITGWQIDESKIPSPKETFKEFPEDNDDYKMTRFLIRLNNITESKKRRQQALILKIEDRTNNIETLQGMSPEKQRQCIRATITRLIAWVMLDHDNEKYPLYNSISRLIDETMKAYERLKVENPEVIKPIDEQYEHQLEQWGIDVMRHELPEKVQKVLDEYEKVA